MFVRDEICVSFFRSFSFMARVEPGPCPELMLLSSGLYFWGVLSSSGGLSCFLVIIIRFSAPRELTCVSM